tara:strand:- start:266 stop:730 length:465 start_codon:yes stop_codon:yes gene_type:complete
MDPITLIGAVKSGLAAGRTIHSMSKQIGQFFDATDNAKKQLQKKGGSSGSVNSIAMERFTKLRQAAQLEEDLKTWICDPRNGLGPSHWQELLKIRREVLQEKREAEAQARRDAIERQEWAITIAGIVILLIFSFVGAVFYLHWMQWLDVRDWIR